MNRPYGVGYRPSVAVIFLIKSNFLRGENLYLNPSRKAWISPDKVGFHREAISLNRRLNFTLPKEAYVPQVNIIAEGTKRLRRGEVVLCPILRSIIS